MRDYRMFVANTMGRRGLLTMKLIVYDMLDFEAEQLAKMQQESQDEIILHKEHLTPETLPLAEGCEGVSILSYSKVDRDLLGRLKAMGVQYLSTRTIGYDHIDIAAAQELGVHVFNAFYQPNNVADFTVMMILLLLRKAKISICRALVNDFSLDGLQGREMRSLTIGVIGTGKIGAQVIRNLSGFGCRILAYSHRREPSLEKLVTYVDLDELYAQSDVITLHIPLNEKNYHMINSESIRKMKKGVLLINTARGQLIDTEALIHALEEKAVGGAGIDTLEEETGVMHVHVGTAIMDDKRSLMYLKQFPNVIYTQHYAFYTKEATESMTRCGITSIQSCARGQRSNCEITK